MTARPPKAHRLDVTSVPRTSVTGECRCDQWRLTIMLPASRGLPELRRHHVDHVAKVTYRCHRCGAWCDWCEGAWYCPGCGDEWYEGDEDGSLRPEE